MEGIEQISRLRGESYQYYLQVFFTSPLPVVNMSSFEPYGSLVTQCMTIDRLYRTPFNSSLFEKILNILWHRSCGAYQTLDRWILEPTAVGVAVLPPKSYEILGNGHHLPTIADEEIDAKIYQ